MKLTPAHASWRLLILFLIGLWSSNAFGQSSQVDADLRRALESSDKVEMLVSFPSVDMPKLEALYPSKQERGQAVYRHLIEWSNQTQASVLVRLHEMGIAYRRLWIANAIYVEGDRALLDTLQLYDQVERIALNQSWFYDPPLPPSAPARGSDPLPWGLTLTHVDQVWDLGFSGEGVVVGGHDTGVEWQHPALQRQYRAWAIGAVDHNYHWYDAIHQINPLHGDSVITPDNNPCGLDVPYPCDDIGSSHGTHTIGTMIGYDPNTNTRVGVAPDAQWVAVRNMERGYGSPASYLEGFQWFLAPTDLHGNNPNPDLAPDVINNSWSCPAKEGCNPSNFALLEAAIDHLRAAGIFVVASAGNSGSKGCHSVSAPPAIYEQAFTVGAIAADDSLASFSSKGPVRVDGSNRLKPNVTAPGVNVRSTIRGGGYGVLSGTSMAGSHVAGLVALLISANPSLRGRVAELEDIIEQSAVPKTERDTCSEVGRTAALPNALHGFGRIDALAAIALALETTPTTGHTNSPGPVLFPNPASSEINVDIRRDLRAGNLTLYDLHGRVIARWELKGRQSTFEVKGLSPGLYGYRLRAGEAVYTGKIYLGGN